MIDVLIVDDDLGGFRPGLEHALKGYRLHFAYSGREGFQQLEKHPEIRLVLLDVKMPPDFAQVEGREGMEVLNRLKQERPDLPVIMLTVLTDVDLVVEAIQAGAFHYITKPIDRDKLRDAVRHATENAELKQRVETMSRARDAMLTVHGARPSPVRKAFHGMVGAHPLMQQLYGDIERAAQFEDMNIVILGETGSGKDLAAWAIHECSPRRRGPFVALNCAALPESMLEGELFGHEKGAFTGAEAKREGQFARADGGTLFLDEIGDMSSALQGKVLRAIENKELTPIGGAPVKVDVRIVCATHRELTEAKNSGSFRPDLYYRIWDIPLRIPALRDRKDDIPSLARHFADDCSRKNPLACTFDPAALEALCEYDWPGNVRELGSAVRRLMVFAEGGCVKESHVRDLLHLPAQAQADGQTLHAGTPQIEESSAEPITENPSQSVTSAPTIEEYPEVPDLTEFCRIHGEIRLKEVLVRALREGRNARGAMALLGMPEDRYDAFRKWLQRLGIKVRELA